MLILPYLLLGGLKQTDNSMTILILESVSPSLRGELSKWLIEVQAGVFVGRINVLIQQSLWERALARAEDGSVTMIWRTNSEQGFDVKTWQPKDYVPLDVEGIWLTLRPGKCLKNK